ncbi:hypothetical protein [Trabulsiella odontotermitis]|uniref:hypothetical protein n=1 Tax=Trabulsiella odontotermitis TaxID=379893 RepID=UPI0006762F96|nr:hypothetical protein [Trabulsiella odontotermitis]KNC91305.1 hypothetical protein GM30_23575 [Trabulsiella odontotermitis]
MAWGIQTWDASGNPNNYGLVPVSVVGFFSVTSGQQSGSAAYTVPSGFVMEVLQVCSDTTYTTKRRRVTVAGGTITIAAASDTDFGANTFPAIAGFVIAYLRAS